MNTEHKSEWLNKKNFAVFVLGIVAVYFMVNSLVDNRLREIELGTRVQLAEQQTVLATIAETTARNGADAVTEAIVRDCSLDERTRFETLLDQLDNNLSRTQLIELERLFGRCGSFFSDRKSVMVSRLSREIQVYEDYVNQLGVVIKEDVSGAFYVAEWKALVAEEQKKSTAFSLLVRQQDQIIAALLEDKSATSPEISDILQQVRETKEAIIMADSRAKEIRSKLISI